MVATTSTRRLAGWLAKPAARVWAFLFLASLSLQFYFSSRVGRPPQVSEAWHQHLGGEYFNIAQALVDGRGFADPFGEATGPTAWMPPLYPSLLALLLWITGSRFLVAGVVLALTHASLATIGTTVHAIARNLARAAPPILVVAFSVVWVAAFNVWFLLITQDIWLTALAVNAMLVVIYRRVVHGETKAWAWTLVGGLVLFLSPALAAPWLVLTAYFAISDRQWRKWGKVLAVVALIGVPWSVRNTLTFHKFIPVKSNLAYDAYAANVLDDDGIYDAKHLMLHPFTNARTRFEYANLGEVGFDEHYRQLMSDFLDHHRGVVFQKVANRAVAAAVYYRSIADDETGWMLFFTRVVYVLPLLSFVLLALLSKRHRKLTDACCLFCATYLAPYVAVAFYVRYWLALTPIFILVVFLAIDTVTERLRRAASSGWNQTPAATAGAAEVEAG
jgi:hypothetical protein